MKGKRKPEGRSLPRSTLKPNLSVHTLNKGAANIEAKSKANPRTTAYIHTRHTIEAFPDVFLLLGGEAGTLIMDSHTDVCHLAYDFDYNGLITLRILQRIGQVVGDNLGEAIHIDFNQHFSRY